MRSKPRRSAMWGRSLLILGALLILAAGAAFAGGRKLARDLRGKKSSDQVNVIVQFNQAITTKHHKAVLKRGGKMRRELKLLRSGAYSIPASALADLEANPDVRYVTVDRPVHGAAAAIVPIAGPRVDYHTDAVQAPLAWAQGLEGVWRRRGCDRQWNLGDQ